MAAPRSTASKAAKKAAAPPSGADLLKSIQPRRRTASTQVCLRSDLVRAFHEADAELVRLKAAASGNANRMTPGGAAESEEVRAQAKRVRKIEEQIVASQVTFEFQAMNRDEWSALTADHPPRKGNQIDHVVGYDRDAVLNAMVRHCLVSPVFEDCTVEEEAGEPCPHEDCGSWQQLVNVINPSEWAELRDTANEANQGVVDAPKSVLASQILDRRASG